ncbi:MAG: hypothetical protein JJW01_01100 [Alphaproteobacteria bacterium]|nr:hypothetical protein [Rickettsiales bacterium]
MHKQGSKNNNTKANRVINELLDGNRRFIENKLLAKKPSVAEIKKLTVAQKPVAAIIACSDSRVSPEIICDQSLGRLFINRNAGNVINDDVLASLEVAVHALAVPLIIVMGHTGCSAVMSSIDFKGADGKILRYLHRLRKKILQTNIFFCNSLGCLKSKTVSFSKYTKNLDDAVLYNIRYSVGEVLKTKYMSSLVKSGKLKIVGAVYDIKTNKLQFLNE